LSAADPQGSWDSVAHHVQFTVPLNIAAFRERVPLDARIVEIGCGYGRVCAELAANGYRDMRGYDASPGMIERACVEHPQMTFTVADATSLPEPDRSFDVVVISALLTCVPAPERQRKVVQEIERVLRPAGAVHGVEFLRQPNTAYPDGGAFHSRYDIPMWHFERDELRRLFGSFRAWTSWSLTVPSLSGTPADILQFVASR
jgi:ubiquinone/menaquinone biosynthesis C-methylase UbiE